MEMLEGIIKMERLKQEYYSALEQASSCKEKPFRERVKILRHYFKVARAIRHHAKTMAKR